MNSRSVIRWYTLFLVCALLIVFVIWIWNYPINLPAPANRTADDFSYALRSSHPELYTTNNQPIFTIQDTLKPAKNWYILKITTKDTPGLSSYLILNDPHFGIQYMQVVAGPQTLFSRQELQSKQMLIPTAVTSTLREQGAL